ncbi:MAG: 2-C-methyl-D-erythritol 4-phosphate cytidylyltransferase [Erysipelotrichaceae bacterium]
MNYATLIMAAGSGTRVNLGYNKLLYQLESGKTILETTVQLFLEDERCKQIVIVVSNHDCQTMQALFHHPKISYVIGGEQRQDSVYNGLKVVKEDYVLIHDGARPYLEMEDVNQLLNTLIDVPACLLMVDVKDTIKVVKDGFVEKTLVRSELKQAQTPQAFQIDCIKKAYEKAKAQGIIATDDAQIVELCGDVKVKAVNGSYKNLKVTTKEDLV